MARLPHLRSVVRNVILVALPLSTGIKCQADDPEESSGVQEHTARIDPAGIFAEELAACLHREEACIALCDAILVEEGFVDSPGETLFLRCEVQRQRDEALVRMSFEPYQTSMGCGVATVTPTPGQSTLGSHFAVVAELEAESIYAFARLAAELTRYGAPSELVDAVCQAAEEEVRHAMLAKNLANHWGVAPVPPMMEPQGERSLLQLCLDNAIDGCVRETLGAAIAEWQSGRALDPAIRSAMREIANDELRHAELALSVDGWLRSQLDPSERDWVEEQTRLTARQLMEEQVDPPDALVSIAGYPRAAESRGLVSALEVERRSARRKSVRAL